MVAGKVKAAMGFHRSPATPKAEATRRSSSTSASHKLSPGTAGHQAPPTPLPSLSPKTAAAFARSFGVYFPRTSAQVQLRPPEVADLLRLVEELHERESRLRTQILEQKLLQETVAIVPFLEKEIADKTDELARARDRIERLEEENCTLRDQIAGLSSKLRSSEEENQHREKKISDLEAELDRLRKVTLEQSNRESQALVEGAIDERSSSQQFQGLIDASARSNLLRNLRKASKCADIVGPSHDDQKCESRTDKADEAETKGAHRQPHSLEKEDVLKPRVARVPKPPPTRNISASKTSSSSFLSETISGVAISKTLKLAELLPPIPPPAGPTRNDGDRPPPPPPPPPPPLPSKGSRSTSGCVRRVPEVVEFYHSLMRRDSKKESSCGGPEVAPISVASNTRNMIGEIENRSAHLLAIKTDVETQGDFIRFLIKEVDHAVFTDIEDVVAFVKWLDDELSFLVDERAVLKHFEWPEHKADAMREAAFGYCDLKKLESEASSFCDDTRQPCVSSLKKMQALLEKYSSEPSSSTPFCLLGITSTPASIPQVGARRLQPITCSRECRKEIQDVWYSLGMDAGLRMRFPGILATIFALFCLFTHSRALACVLCYRSSDKKGPCFLCTCLLPKYAYDMHKYRDKQNTDIMGQKKKMTCGIKLGILLKYACDS
ncbi:hypothetical protein ZIOFF_018141 [Zingiber officinale]|uniref:Protein CHUP1, chloroplastic n=1 Tax=Zingiber officinale TaxID=94328 RepID=A0A8J5H5P4_ZINOF|nr:hypothetical protein ZIOFF_018141 [Zingiber officinale]